MQAGLAPDVQRRSGAGSGADRDGTAQRIHPFLHAAEALTRAAKKILRRLVRRSRGAKLPEPGSQQSVHSLSPGL